MEITLRCTVLTATANKGVVEILFRSTKKNGNTSRQLKDTWEYWVVFNRQHQPITPLANAPLKHYRQHFTPNYSLILHRRARGNGESRQKSEVRKRTNG